MTIVDIADMAVSSAPEDVLVTYSLGSCIGVAIHDPVAGVGGMVHCMLPLSMIDAKKAVSQPCMFVDTGFPILLEALLSRGLRKARASVWVAGGATVVSMSDMFRIGERNCAVLRKLLWKNGMLITGADVGGSVSRTIRLEIGTGRFFVKESRSLRELKRNQVPTVIPLPAGTTARAAINSKGNAWHTT